MSNIKKEDIPNLVLYAVALAMSIVSLVLGVVGEIETDTIFTLLGIGMFCLAVAGINKIEKS